MIEPAIDNNNNADYDNLENAENQNTSNISSMPMKSENVDYNKNLVAAPKFTNALN